MDFGGVRWTSVGVRWSLTPPKWSLTPPKWSLTPPKWSLTPPKSNPNPPNWVVGGVTLFGELVIVPDESILDFVGFAAKEK